MSRRRSSIDADALMILSRMARGGRLTWMKARGYAPEYTIEGPRPFRTRAVPLAVVRRLKGLALIRPGARRGTVTLAAPPQDNPPADESAELIEEGAAR